MAKDKRFEKKEEKHILLQGKLPTSAADISKFVNNLMQSNTAVVASEAEDDEDFAGAPIYSTGALSLDKYLGIGGLQGGRVVNLWGWEGCGKSLEALSIAAEFQRRGLLVAFLDAEGTFNHQLARSVGVDTRKLILVQSTPEKILSGEDYFDIAKTLVQLGIGLIIVDSIPALVPKAKLTATIGEGKLMQNPQMMSEGLSQLTPILAGLKKSILLCINQMRAVPGQMFGPPEQHTGGNAILFYQSYSIEVRKITDIKAKVKQKNGTFEEERIGVTVKNALHKNKTASIPMESVEMDIYFTPRQSYGADGKALDLLVWELEDGTKRTPGLDVYKDLVKVATKDEVIQKSSSWHYYGDIKTNGEDAFIAALRAAGPKLLDEIRDKVLNPQKYKTVAPPLPAPILTTAPKAV